MRDFALHRWSPPRLRLAQGAVQAAEPAAVEVPSLSWPEQIVVRGALFSLAMPVGFLVSAALSALVPAFRSDQREALLLAGISAGIGAAATLLPVEGRFFDLLARVGGSTAGIFLGSAAVPARKGAAAA